MTKFVLTLVVVAAAFGDALAQRKTRPPNVLLNANKPGVYISVFRPTISEEELTTKHYRFPGSQLVITASVFYTDESLASHGHVEFVSHSDSMVIGVTVSRRAKQNAIDASARNNGIAEVTYNQYTNKVRAKKFVAVHGRVYLVGIECDCMANKRPN